MTATLPDVPLFIGFARGPTPADPNLLGSLTRLVEPLDLALTVRPGDPEAVGKGPDFGEARAFYPNQRPGGMMNPARNTLARARKTPGALVIRIRRRFNSAALPGWTIRERSSP